MGRYRVVYKQDDLTIFDDRTGMELPVWKRGASGMVGQLLSRRFVVGGQDRRALFEAVDGNSGTLPRASLRIDGKEVLALVAGGGCFKVACSLCGESLAFKGDPFSGAFSVAGNGKILAEVTARRGSGQTVYRFEMEDDADPVLVLATVSTLAVFRGRLIPCVEPADEDSAA